jgi:hypothetical protein
MFTFTNKVPAQLDYERVTSNVIDNIAEVKHSSQTIAEAADRTRSRQ